MSRNRAVLWMRYPELNGSLYHGSTVRVEHVELRFSVPSKDFGRGFCTTAARDQAVKFAALKAKNDGVFFGLEYL